MGLANLPLWRAGIFRQIKYIFSTPVRIQKCLFISETGNISLQLLPLARGYTYNDEAKVAWAVLNLFTIPIEGLDGEVMPISERSCIPLDPHKQLSDEDRESLANINQIAEEHYQAAYSQVADEDRKSVNVQMAKTLMWMGFLVVIVIVLALLWTKRG